jgi:predicted outer membrane repeat protein
MRRQTVLLFVLLAALSSLASAQTTRPVRGAYSTGVAYAVPGGIQTRGSVFVVTTTADEEDLEGCDPTAGEGLSLREAIEYCDQVDTNAIIYVPAGLYEITDDMDAEGYTSLAIIGEDPLTTIIDNIFEPDSIRVDISSLGLDLGTVGGVTISVSNFTLRSSSSVTHAADGGAIIIYGDGAATLNNIVFEGTTAISGGAVYAESSGIGLQLSGSNLTFTGNSALSYGGGLYFDGAGADSSLWLESSVFTGNEAASGGGIYVSGLTDVTVINSTFIDNSASGIFTADGEASNDEAGKGGGALLQADAVSIIGSQFSNNHAGQSALSGIGGGIYFVNQADLLNTLIEDNRAPGGFGPNCFTEEFVTSLGGNAFSSLLDCAVNLHDGDQTNNLLINGGFEVGSGKKPTGWNVKMSNVSRTCNTPNKLPATEFGSCALVLSKGGSAQQKANLNDIVFTADTHLRLSAEGKLSGAAKGKIKIVLIYTDGAMNKQVSQIKFTDPAFKTNYASLNVMINLESASVSKLIMTISHSGGGKFSVDRVSPRGAMPLPAAPAGFRGNN